MGVEPGFDGGEVGEDGAAVEEGAGGATEATGTSLSSEVRFLYIFSPLLMLNR